VYATLGLLQAVGLGVAAIVVVILAIFVASVILSAIKVVKEYERGVIFRLGRVQGGPKGPGLFILLPMIDRMVKIDLRTVTMDVPPQDVITRDNVPARVNAVVYFRVTDPNKSVIEVENHVLATSQISQTTLRSVLGQKDLDELLTNREEINEELQAIIDEQTDPWGVKVSVVEVKDVEIPTQMQRAMARQAESERERRAKIIAAEGEYQASERLRQAADRLESPTALQLRLFQTMGEIAVNQNSTIILPVPIDLIRPFLESPDGAGSHGQEARVARGRGSRALLRRGCRRRLARGVDRRRTGPRPSTFENRTYLAREHPNPDKRGSLGPKRADKRRRSRSVPTRREAPCLPRRVSVVYIWVRRFPKLQSYASGKLSRQCA
jgi:regulator of protease activity HflC (stomatin/prohibitin superfamily)